VTIFDGVVENKVEAKPAPEEAEADKGAAAEENDDDAAC